VVVFKPSGNKFFVLDSGTTRDGSSFTGMVQRTGLSVVGRKRSGEWVEDFEKGKLVSKVWPKASGGPINVRVGYQGLANGPVTWGGAQSFDPSSQQFVDGVLGSAVGGAGKAVSIEFSSASDFRLDGYKLDMAVTGKF